MPLSTTREVELRVGLRALEVRRVFITKRLRLLIYLMTIGTMRISRKLLSLLNLAQGVNCLA